LRKTNAKRYPLGRSMQGFNGNLFDIDQPVPFVAKWS
jgi:hypothetical protein